MPPIPTQKTAILSKFRKNSIFLANLPKFYLTPNLLYVIIGIVKGRFKNLIIT